MAKDGTTTPSSTNGGDRQPSGGLLDEMRQELERAAEDLERVTGQLHQRTDTVEQYEVLVDELLDLLAVPAVVIDEDARVTALSRGAAHLVDDPAAALGKQASSVLPPAVAKRVTAHVRSVAIAASDGRRAAGSRGGDSGAEEGDGGDGPAVRFRDLPGGSTLVVLEVLEA